MGRLCHFRRLPVNNRENRYMVNDSRILPPDPLDFIQQCVRNRRIVWTYHVNMRLATKLINRVSILESTHAYEIIESYPDDKYLPSYLTYTEYEGERFHVLFATDVEGDNVRIVTIYRPSSIEWLPDMKTRRTS